MGVSLLGVEVKHLESSTKRMISRSWKDEKDKKELKQIITQIDKYINAIHHPSPQTLSQVAVSFDPKSPANQNMLDQVKRNKMVAKMFNKCIDVIIQQGSYYIVSLVKVYEDAVIVINELELEVVAWEKERTKWVVVLVQMNDVQKFGVMKFLVEKHVESSDDNVLYVLKKNVEWQNSIIKHGHKESTRLLKGLTDLINIMQKYLKCIDIQLMEEDSQTIEAATDMVKIFQERIQFIRETKSLTKDDFSKVNRIESMLTVCSGHLEVQKERLS